VRIRRRNARGRIQSSRIEFAGSSFTHTGPAPSLCLNIG
jgi:hypothetical protein